MKDSGDGTTREKKTWKTDAEMGGLCQPRAIGATKVNDRNGWRIIVSATATIRLSGSG